MRVISDFRRTKILTAEKAVATHVLLARECKNLAVPSDQRIESNFSLITKQEISNVLNVQNWDAVHCVTWHVYT